MFSAHSIAVARAPFEISPKPVSFSHAAFALTYFTPRGLSAPTFFMSWRPTNGASSMASQSSKLLDVLILTQAALPAAIVVLSLSNMMPSYLDTEPLKLLRCWRRIRSPQFQRRISLLYARLPFLAGLPYDRSLFRLLRRLR
jgi:hypothetical protein